MRKFKAETKRTLEQLKEINRLKVGEAQKRKEFEYDADSVYKKRVFEKHQRIESAVHILNF